ncbi:hypothetical protein ACIO5Z_31715 [Streptomyces rochei]|uniref:hypothetical protein n=1 Tax=Streptomyces rochei TaxID=1928 RepID=UPI00368AB546
MAMLALGEASFIAPVGRCCVFAICKYRSRFRYARQVAETADRGVEIVRFRSPRQVQQWK